MHVPFVARRVFSLDLKNLDLYWDGWFKIKATGTNDVKLNPFPAIAPQKRERVAQPIHKGPHLKTLEKQLSGTAFNGSSIGEVAQLIQLEEIVDL